MAASASSSLFDRLTRLWRHLPLRSDVDEIILELLGRFSLEKIYCDTDKETYQRLVITLLSQLTAICYVQRLTFPAESIHPGPYLGLIASWEVILRSIEFILQTITDGRELLWEYRQLRDKYLAEFLVLALRLIALHPRGLTTQRVRDRRDRFARVHKSLEQLFDSYPGEKSFLLLLCKELTSKLQANPNALGLPPRLRNELPNLTSDLYPLADCLGPEYILELVPDDPSSDKWLNQFLTLRDICHFILGACIEQSVNQDSPDFDLISSCADSRDAILLAIDNLRLPAQFSKTDVAADLSDTFRIILPDTLDLVRSESHSGGVDEFELDALDSLSVRLGDKQIIHRVSDGEMMHSVSQVIREIVDQDNPTEQVGSTHPGLFVTESGLSYFELPPHAQCVHCGEEITLAREIQLARRAWDLLGELEVDASTINVERHLPTVFQTRPEPPDVDNIYGHAGDVFAKDDRKLQLPSHASNYSLYRGHPSLVSHSTQDRSTPLHPVLPSPSSSRFFDVQTPYRQDISRHGSTSYVPSTAQATSRDMPSIQLESTTSDDPKSSSQDSRPQKMNEPVSEKTKSRWKLSLGTLKKPLPPPAASGDSSSLSSTSVENQKLEEIPLYSLMSGQKNSGRNKSGRNIQVRLSQSSPLAIFWTQLSLQVYNIGASPPKLIRAIDTESTCILATVGKTHLAYMVGTRDQRLTLKILDLAQPSSPVVEYRMTSNPWCRSIATDRNENYVVVGFENSIVRFFKVAAHEQPREDRLHQYHDCKACPSVDTLSFSNDGLALMGSTRNAKTGMIQLYIWRFPFLTHQELTACRYSVPLHESEDNGVSAAVYRSGADGDESLVCITTWTQSGTPMLIDPRTGHKSPIKTELAGRSGKLGNRIQQAAFSSAGQDLAMVNDKGHLYHISNLNSRPMDIRRISTSKELTGKSSTYAMEFVSVADEEHVILAWTDSSKPTGWVKKIPISAKVRTDSESALPRGQLLWPAELAAEHGRTELEANAIGR
ncbi:hypothetical protein S40288_11011 [Stachybotrys chartarum IBT 40288]|nr:hypothetical protein S40288_11011 [Stachybotrys chartarum IBT 40288]